jgi:hypothetical protein
VSLDASNDGPWVHAYATLNLVAGGRVRGRGALARKRLAGWRAARRAACSLAATMGIPWIRII